MKSEFHRQLVHISGILFVALAQFVGPMISIWFFMIAITLFLYSHLIHKEYKRARLIAQLENRIKETVMHFERENVRRPFTGAVWFFFSMGLVFLFFPIHIASAAAICLSIGDGLSTLAGKRLGGRAIAGEKTLSGSIACFIGSLCSFVFIGPVFATLAAFTATIAELLPATSPLLRIKERGLIDDNFLVPVLTALILLLTLA